VCEEFKQALGKGERILLLHESEEHRGGFAQFKSSISDFSKRVFEDKQAFFNAKKSLSLRRAPFTELLCNKVLLSMHEASEGQTLIDFLLFDE
jgi:hypothetical protein